MSFAPEAIETWPLNRLRPYAANAKTHGEGQAAKIAASMAEFGWTNPVLVSGDGEVIADHGRILAATRLGLTEAPVIALDHLSKAPRLSYRRQQTHGTWSLREKAGAFVYQPIIWVKDRGGSHPIRILMEARAVLLRLGQGQAPTA